MDILIISELNDYLSSKKIHFSLTKGFEFAKGLSNNNLQVYYLTLGKSIIYEKINFINISEITLEFLKKIKYLMLIREINIYDILEKSGPIKNFMINKRNDVKVVMKSDTIDWICSKEYNIKFQELGLKFINFVTNTFSMICCQTEKLASEGLAKIKKNYGDDIYEKIANKIFISRMGIPNKNPIDKTIISPYDITHSYCVENYKNLTERKALFPLYFIKPYSEFTNKSIENFNKKKIIIIYCGRVKTDNGKVFFLMRDIMKKLGDNYELHIFPGRFIIPNFDVSVLSPKYGMNLQLLRDNIFFDSDNVIIHYPFEEYDKTIYLRYADIAIDFSPTRPHDIISSAGNAKLLEYCYYGLPVVCDKNIGNSYLVENCKNGILLEGIPTIDDYVNAIREISNNKINKQLITNYIINNHNWDIIAKELFTKLQIML